MARMNGKSRFPIDAALILRDAGLAAVSVDTDLAVQKLASVGAYWQNPPDARDGVVYVVGHAEAVSDTVSLDFYTCEDAAKTNPKLQKSVPLTVGEWFEEPVDQMSWLRNHPAATNWYVTINVAGSTHTAAVFVYLAPDWDC